MYYSDFDNNICDEICEINIKVLSDKYEINLNKIIKKTNYVSTYEGINIIDNTKIIIDKYNNYNILSLCKKISNNIIILSHPNIINILDIIIEKCTAYIIKPYYDNNIKNVLTNNLTNNKIKTQYINYCKQIFDAIYYLIKKNINIETLYIDNIFINNNIIIISPYFGDDITKHKNILYGSPLYSPPELFNKYIPEKEAIIVWNLGMIFYQILFNKNPFDNFKEYDDILYNKNTTIYDNDFYNLNNSNDLNEFIDIIVKMIETDKKKEVM